MKYIQFVILFLYINQLQAAQYIQAWKKVEIKSEEELHKILTRNNCTTVKKQIVFFKEKNKLVTLRFPNKGLVQNCLVEKRFSDQELGIMSWENHVVKRNENISSLIKSTGCRDIFTKQIPEFEKRNNIRNGDIVSIGQEVQIQSCKEEISEKTETVVVEEKKKEEVLNKPFYNTISIGFNSAVFSMIDYKHDNFVFKLSSSEKDLLIDLSLLILNTKKLDFFTGISFEDFDKKSLNFGLSLNLENLNYKVAFSNKKLMTNFHYKIWKESGIFLYTRYGNDYKSLFPGIFFTF